VLARLAGIRDGRLAIREEGRETVLGDPGASLRAAIEVRHPAFWPAAAFRGSVGAGEAYRDGLWAADDLAAVVRLLVRNREVLDGLETGLARLGGAALRAFHALRENTVAGSRRNIAAHYDLGDDFFSLFLDPTLTYSCAVFEEEGSTLEEAQVAKVDGICRRLGLRPGHHLLEIGTGWGYLAVHAAGRYGCRVTTTTLSERQHARARERVARAGLEGRVAVLRRDWRDLEGLHDRLVSVEMVEAVGWRRLPAFLAKCADLLRPEGAALIQAITIADAHYERARRSVDFIQRHVFPGSCIPSLGSLAAAAAGTDLRIVRVEDIGPHYARTLREWRTRFLARAEEVRALGFDDRFLRLWEFYLAYCEGGFEERALGDAQILLEKPRARIVPASGRLP
jgi:cyclopropane-fatty-acyl-phospholipid synthase